MSALSFEVAVLFLTPACDMACPYCGAESSFKPIGPAQAKELLEDLARQGVRSVVLGGGEPFCWPFDLRTLAFHAKSLGLEVQVGTNGNLLPADAPRWEEVDRWVLPLESDEAVAHDALRPGPDSHHARMLGILRAMASAGRSVTVSSVARRGGLKDLDGVARLLEAQVLAGLKLHAWHLYRFQAMGRHGRDHADDFSLTEDAWASLSQGLRMRHPGLPLLLRPDMMHSKRVAFFWSIGSGLWQQGPGSSLIQHSSYPLISSQGHL